MTELNTRTITGLFCLLCIFISVLDIFLKNEKNLCEMTYMLDPPQFIPVEMPEQVNRQFPKYNLFIYGESVYARQLFQKPRDLSGLPVLFVHGNAGSYRQARSIASVLLLKWEMQNQPYHFNVFTVDFGEELSALYGPFLDAQVEYLHHCIREIRLLYKSDNLSIPVIAHSMGGMVVKALYTLDDFDPTSILFILTLSTPHKQPVLATDATLAHFYRRVDARWNDFRPLFPVLVSVSAGRSDKLVSPALTDLTLIGRSTSRDLSVVSDSLPRCWASMDHLAVVWCRQIVLAAARSLNELVSLGDFSYVQDSEEIYRVLQWHFQRRSSFYGSFRDESSLRERPISAQREWMDQFEKVWTFSRKKILSGISLTIPIYEAQDYVVSIEGLSDPHWIFGCTNISKTDSKVICLSAVSVSLLSEVVPAFWRQNEVERRVWHSEGAAMKRRGFEYLLIQLAPSTHPVKIVGERHSRVQRHRNVTAPQPYEGILAPKRLLSVHLAESARFYNLSLTGFNRIWQAYDVTVVTKLCRSDRHGGVFVRFYVPWSQHSEYFEIGEKSHSATRFPIRLMTSPHATSGAGLRDDDYDVIPEVGAREGGFFKPPVSDDSVYSSQRRSKRSLMDEFYGEDSWPELHFYLDPACAYEVEIQWSIRMVLGQICRQYIVAIPAYVIALLLATLGEQWESFGKTTIFPHFLQSLLGVNYLISFTIFPTLMQFSVWPFLQSSYVTPDSLGLSAIETLVLRVVLYYSAIGVLIVASGALYVANFGVSSIILRFMRFTQIPVTKVIPQVFQFSLWPIVVSAMLVTLAQFTHGTVCLLVLPIVYFFESARKTARCRYIEDRRGNCTLSTSHYGAFSLFLLILVAALMRLPNAISWLHHMTHGGTAMNYPTSPVWDTLQVGLLLTLGCILCQPWVPHSRSVLNSTAKFVITGVSFFPTIYGPSSFYALETHVVVALVVIFVQQIVTFCGDRTVHLKES